MSTTITGLTPTEVTGFNGLWARGTIEECPVDHNTDCQNCIFPGKNQVDIRPGATIQNKIATRGFISYAIANVAGGASLLTLNANGDFWDETHASLLLNVSGADDFRIINIFGRSYISFITAGKPFAGAAVLYVYYYNGTSYVLTTAGSAAPTGTVTLTETGGGQVQAGVHQIYVAFQNDRGFLSPPGAHNFIISSGGHPINVAAIPVGPVGTVARVLFMSPANQTEIFFVPGGTIPDNVTTTASINSSDSELIASADYLFDINTTPFSGASFAFYHGRLVVIGQKTSPDDILFSDVDNPESFNKVTGVVHMPVDYGINTSNGSMVIRDTLYITKPNGTYSTQDNGSTPDTWQVSIIDSGIGAWSNGISVFQSSMSGQDVLDSCLIANKRGLMLFDGTYGQVPLTYKIETLWQKISQNYFYLVHVTHDTWAKRIYIYVPISINPNNIGGTVSDANTLGSGNILMCDYNEGLGPTTVKWSYWRFQSSVNKIDVLNFTLAYAQAMIYQFTYCAGDTIYKVVDPNGLPDTISGSPDTSVSIDQILSTGPIPNTSVAVNTYQGMVLSVKGASTFNLFAAGKYGSNLTALTSFNLDIYPSSAIFREMNIVSENLYVRLRNSNILASANNSRFIPNQIFVYFKKMWLARPALTQST